MITKKITLTESLTRSIARIEKFLLEIGATNIRKEYTNKSCTGITFQVFDEQLQRVVPFHFRVQIEECFTFLWKNVKNPQTTTQESVRQQAIKFAWLTLADWTETQCCMILMNQVKPLQLFLPFMYDEKAKETLFDKVTNGKVKLLLGV